MKFFRTRECCTVKALLKDLETFLSKGMIRRKKKHN